MVLRTYNFREEPYPYTTAEQFKGEYSDLRNGIICINPTCDFECYINYLRLLNSRRNTWTNYGYLDLGMMPIAMAPSFMQDVMRETMLKVSRDIGLQIYSRPPISFTYTKCNLSIEDVWAFKEDVAKVMEVPPEGLTLEKFLRWCADGRIKLT